MIADLIGKGKHIRTVPVPVWAKNALDAWRIGGTLYRPIERAVGALLELKNLR